MAELIQAYPLAWPAGWRRMPPGSRTYDRFGTKADGRYGSRELTIAQAVDRVLDELKRMGVPDWNIIISTNVEPTLSGMPRSNSRNPEDPGVAVYFRKRNSDEKDRKCIAIDRYRSVAGNLAAIAATLEAMRAIERHGGAEILDRAFTGFTALPAPEQPWQVLGLGTSRPTREQIDEAYRRLAMQHHPDRGGDAQQMARINAARDELYAGLAG